MAQPAAPLPLAEGLLSDDYFVMEDSLAVSLFQVCWLCKAWTVALTSMLRFKGDLNSHEQCVLCDTFMRNRLRKKCDLWKGIMQNNASLTGAMIRADAVSVNLHKKDYAETFKKEYMYRSYMVDRLAARTYHGERMSPFDPRCVGVESLHLNK